MHSGFYMFFIGLVKEARQHVNSPSIYNLDNFQLNQFSSVSVPPSALPSPVRGLCNLLSPGQL